MPLWLPASVIFEYVCYIVSVSEANKYSQAVRHIVPHAARKSTHKFHAHKYNTASVHAYSGQR